MEDAQQPHAWSDVESPLQDPGERQVIFAAIDSFQQYRKHAHHHTTHRRRQNLYALPMTQWKLLAAPPFAIQDTFNVVDDAIDANADLADVIYETGLRSFELPAQPAKSSILDWRGCAKKSDLSKAHSTLRQFYRDWSREGFEEEVDPILQMVKYDLVTHLHPLSSNIGYAEQPDILLPGAGLGRLLFELCLAGNNVEGNEISYHQLLASNYILNCTRETAQHKIYPFATTFTNNISRTAQLRSFSIPDIHPSTAMAAKIAGGGRVGQMNMTAGDFITSYNKPDNEDAFDAVVTVFFLDTAPNLFRYIQTIHHCLKPGGIWTNIGPLLWHFDDRGMGGGSVSAVESSADELRMKDDQDTPNMAKIDKDEGIGEPGSFELTNEEVLLLVEQLGFKIEKQELVDGGSERQPEIERNGNVSSRHGGGFGYIQDPNSMLQNRYTCAHWVARKKTP